MRREWRLFGIHNHPLAVCRPDKRSRRIRTLLRVGLPVSASCKISLPYRIRHPAARSADTEANGHRRIDRTRQVSAGAALRSRFGRRALPMRFTVHCRDLLARRGSLNFLSSQSSTAAAYRSNGRNVGVLAAAAQRSGVLRTSGPVDSGVMVKSDSCRQDRAPRARSGHTASVRVSAGDPKLIASPLPPSLGTTVWQRVAALFALPITDHARKRLTPAREVGFAIAQPLNRRG